MCQEIARAVTTRFGTSDPEICDGLLLANITCCGPYCLGESAHQELDPWFLERGRQIRHIDHQDLRLDDPSGTANWSSLKDESRTIKVVLYVVITAPPKSDLPQYMPELDSHTDMPFHPNIKWPPDSARGIHRSMAENVDGLPQPTLGIPLEIKYRTSLHTLDAVERSKTPYIDIKLCREWLQQCESQHGTKCQVDDPQMVLPRGFRAIDTHRLCIVNMDSSSDLSFAALSYTWGKSSGSKEIQLERGNLEDLMAEGALKSCEGIPDLILDAITLCADLGHRLLWVDRLCIIQDDASSKHSQIQAMDRIYHLASFTIVAAVPNLPGLGLPGVRNRPRQSPLWNHTRRFHPKTRVVVDNFDNTVMDSNWNSRGWTFQERILSRRRLYITRFEAYFQCNTFSRQEDLGDIAAALNPWSWNLPQYLSTIPTYTSRNLSFDSDILNAFVGIGNRFARVMNTNMISGLPERYLAQALLWENSEHTQRRTNTRDIPSWSWAAWKGRVHYENNSLLDKLSTGTLVQFHYQDPMHGLRSIKEEQVWFFKGVDLETLEDLPTTDEEYPEMRFMPEADISNREWRNCPHNPWAVPAQSLDSDGRDIASRHPGCLVFCTTMALLHFQKYEAIDRAWDYLFNPSDFIMCDILDGEGCKVGKVSKLHKSWAMQKFRDRRKNAVIVLSAGIMSEPSRYAQTHPILLNLGERKEPDANASPWYLHVMVVERDEPTGVYRRLGIGWVETRLWKQCKPTWTTVVLV